MSPRFHRTPHRRTHHGSSNSPPPHRPQEAPSFRIIVADSTSPRDGRFIEIIGQYFPRQGDKAVQLNTERANHWLDVGALPSDTVRSLLRKAGVLKARHEARLARKLNSSAVPVREASEPAASSDASE